MNKRFRTSTAALLAACLVLVAAGCATVPQPAPVSPGETLDWPASVADADPRPVFRVDREASELRVLVAPAGRLARFGHHHVIGGPVWSGRVHLGPSAAETGIDLAIDVGRLVVDRPEWRAAEGHEPLDEAAIEGTRRNLLGPQVLDAEAHPRIEIRSVSATGPLWQADVRARIRLGGRVVERVVPVAVELDGSALVATGRFDLQHTELGLTPFAAAGGALQVADRIGVRFRIVARRASD